MKTWLVHSLMLVTCLEPVCRAWTLAHDKALKTQLFTTNGYDSSSRPSSVTNIDVAFFVTSIDSIDLKGETWALTGWWFLNWRDARLSWDKTSYGGIDTQIYKPADVWTPSIVVINSVSSLSAINDSSIPMRVDDGGMVFWRPPGILEMSCDMDTTYFPFDRQECTIDILEFGYTTSEMTLSSGAGILINDDYFSESGEYDVLATDHEVEALADNALSYDKISFTMYIQRKSTAYWFAILIPVISNCFLIPIVFLLPPSSGEKMGYTLTVLLSFVVLLTLITDSLSTSSKSTSLLEVYITVVLLMSVWSVLFTCVSVWCFNKHETEGAPSSGCQKLAHLANVLMLKEKCGGDKTGETTGAAVSSGANTPDNDIEMKAKDDDTNRVPNSLSYLQLAEIMDAFLLRVYGILAILMTVIFLFVLGLGATTQEITGTSNLKFH